MFIIKCNSMDLVSKNQFSTALMWSVKHFLSLMINLEVLKTFLHIIFLNHLINGKESWIFISFPFLLTKIAWSFPLAWLNVSQVFCFVFFSFLFLTLGSYLSFVQSIYFIKLIITNPFSAPLKCKIICCHFYNAGFSFSFTWNPSPWNVIIKKEWIPVFPSLWEGRRPMSWVATSKHRWPNHTDLAPH